MNRSRTDRWGIVTQFQDTAGKWRRISSETQAAIRRAMQIPEQPADRSIPPPVVLLRSGASLALDRPAEVVLEDGTRFCPQGALPADLPIGYHQLHWLRDDSYSRLIVSPGTCHLPASLRAWGWAVQLYAVRSSRSWGMGDLGDLRELARWSAKQGAGFAMLNPLGAVLPLCPQQPSPYFPSSRRFRNPLYLRVEEVPGARAARIDLRRLAADGRALNRGERIDRDAIFRLKLAALERLFTHFNGDARFDRFCAEHGTPLSQFATFCVLAEQHGTGWRQWPARFRQPSSAAVARFAAEHPARCRFHQWLQWLLDEQLARAAQELPLINDLPIGVDPNGADAWAWQDVLAKDVTVGAPPDQFNTLGQDWGLPPFIPHRLRAEAYGPFRETIRASLRHAGGLRIDHVMGLFRLFWIPRDRSPAQGAYVRYPAEELLAVLAIESQRARAVVIGEDLGTVEDGVRTELRRRRLLSYRLLWFEPRAPRHYPQQALAAVTTHDLFTIAGLWTGSDLQAQERLGLHPNRAGTEAIRRKLVRLTRRPTASLGTRGQLADGSVEDVVVRIYDALAQAPSMLLAATLDDAVGAEQRPNLPGTTTEWPNWSIPLPQGLEQIRRRPLVRAIARTLGSRRPQD